MDGHGKRNSTSCIVLAAIAVLGVASCNQVTETQTASTEPAPAAGSKSPPAELQSPGPAEEYGEYLARPTELVSTPTNDIPKSLRLNRVAMKLGQVVYAAHCQSCHGEDLKGAPGASAPDLTDSVWKFSGDDLVSGGVVKFPSDVEWTVRYGIRSGHDNTRGLEVGMLAYDPQFRTPMDTSDFGPDRFLDDAQIADVAEYVLQLGRQQHDAAKARNGAILFQDNAKGNCFDCHGEDGTGIMAFGSTDLTSPNLYLYGSDRAAIIESITKGRHGTMPAFDTALKPEEIKSVSVYVFYRATPLPPAP